VCSFGKFLFACTQTKNKYRSTEQSNIRLQQVGKAPRPLCPLNKSDVSSLVSTARLTDKRTRLLIVYCSITTLTVVSPRFGISAYLALRQPQKLVKKYYHHHHLLVKTSTMTANLVRVQDQQGSKSTYGDPKKNQQKTKVCLDICKVQTYSKIIICISQIK